VVGLDANRWQARGVSGVTLRRRLATLRLLRRTGGARAVLVHAVAVLGYRKILVYELDLGSVPEPVQALATLDYGWLDEVGLDALRRQRPDVPPETYDARLARGDRCWVARQDGRVVSSRWVTLGPAAVDSTGVRCTLPAGYAYVHDSFTSADVRGRRVGPSAATRLAEALAAEGCRMLVAFVEAGNHWAVRNAENSGYAEAGSLAKVAAGRWAVPVYRRSRLDARIAR